MAFFSTMGGRQIRRSKQILLRGHLGRDLTEEHLFNVADIERGNGRRERDEREGVIQMRRRIDDSVVLDPEGWRKQRLNIRVGHCRAVRQAGSGSGADWWTVARKCLELLEKVSLVSLANEARRLRR